MKDTSSMYLNQYLPIFSQCAQRFNKEHSAQTGLEAKAVIWLDCVVLKVQKPSWLNQVATAKPFKESVFFSVWINEKPIRESKILYNIHALKLRELTGYTIKSRDFAADFRLKFKPFEKDWPNVSTAFGPLTLMEGWVGDDYDHLEKTVFDLAVKFTDVAFIIDELLADRQK